MRAQGVGSDTHSYVGDFSKQITPKSGKKIMLEDYEPVSPCYSPTLPMHDKLGEQEYYQASKSQISELSDLIKTPTKNNNHFDTVSKQTPIRNISVNSNIKQDFTLGPYESPVPLLKLQAVDNKTP
jgi:hypothetical protein